MYVRPSLVQNPQLSEICQITFVRLDSCCCEMCGAGFIYLNLGDTQPRKPRKVLRKAWNEGIPATLVRIKVCQEQKIGNQSSGPFLQLYTHLILDRQIDCWVINPTMRRRGSSFECSSITSASFQPTWCYTWTKIYSVFCWHIK